MTAILNALTALVPSFMWTPKMGLIFVSGAVVSLHVARYYMAKHSITTTQSSGMNTPSISADTTV